MFYGNGRVRYGVAQTGAGRLQTLVRVKHGPSGLIVSVDGHSLRMRNTVPLAMVGNHGCVFLGLP